MLVLCARHSKIDHLFFGRIELRFGLRYIGARCYAGIVPRLRQLQKTGVRFHGGFEQRDIAIGPAQLKIVLRQIRLVSELCVLKLRLSGLSRLRISANIAPDGAPQIHLIGDIEGDLKSW